MAKTKFILTLVYTLLAYAKNIRFGIGKCLAIVRPATKAGKIALKATADGLKPGKVVITSNW